MKKRIVAIGLALGLTFGSSYASEMLGSPHIYDFEDSEGTLWDKLPSDGKTPQWRGHVTNSALETLISDSDIDVSQGRYVNVFPQKSEHVIQHNFRPEWFSGNSEVSISFAVKFKNPSRTKQIYIYDENGKTATQIFEAKANKGNDAKSSIGYIGKWQTGVNSEGTPIFEANKDGVIVDRGNRVIEWNASSEDWFYVNYLVDTTQKTYKMYILTKDGQKVGGATNYGEHGVLHPNFKGVPSKIEFKTLGGGVGGETTFLDDIIFTNYSETVDVFAPKEISPHEKSVELKFSSGFASENQPKKDEITITQTKFDKVENYSDFEIKNTPNGIKIMFNSPLESTSEYKVSFSENVKTVFGQSVGDYIVNTTAKDGYSAIKSITFYDKNDVAYEKNKIPANVSKAKIVYDRNMNEELLSNLKIENADFTSSYDSTTFSQTLNFQKALMPFSKYEVIGNESIKSEELLPLESFNLGFTPVTSKFNSSISVKDDKTEILSASGLKGGSNLAIKGTVSSDIDVLSQNVNMSVLLLKNDELLQSKIVNGKIENSKSVELLTDFQLPQDVTGCSLRVLILDDEFRPIGNYKNINGV